MSAYIWDEMKTEKQKNANYQKVLEKKLDMIATFFMVLTSTKKVNIFTELLIYGKKMYDCVIWKYL